MRHVAPVAIATGSAHAAQPRAQLPVELSCSSCALFLFGAHIDPSVHGTVQCSKIGVHVKSRCDLTTRDETWYIRAYEIKSAAYGWRGDK